MTSENNQNLVREHFRAINKPQKKGGLLKFFLLVLFIGIFSFFIFSDVLAISVFNETFDSYESGYQLNSYPIWTESDDDWLITGTGCYSGNCVIGVNPVETPMFGIGENIDVGEISFYFIFDEIVGNNFGFGLEDRDEQSYGWDTISCIIHGELNGEILNIKLYNRNLTGQDLIAENLASDVWNYIKIEWKTENNFVKKVRYNLNNFGWTDWFDTRRDDRVSVNQFYGTLIDSDYVSFDEIKSFLGCSFENCDLCYNENSCFFAGCDWNSETELCDFKPYGVCSAGTYLQFCKTQFDCEALGVFGKLIFVGK